MRILVHDFGAYPFSVQLARRLAERGHTVRYLYLEEDSSIRGDVAVKPSDADTFSSLGIRLPSSDHRRSFLRRISADVRYGLRLPAEVQQFEPDVVLSADCPLVSQWILQRSSRRSGATFVYWLQDLFGVAIAAVLGRKNKTVGKMLAMPFRRLEHRLLLSSDEVIAISPAFVEYVLKLGVEPSSVHLLPNWAPLGAVPLPDAGSRWASKNGLPDGPRILYSGTLGLKHNPDLLVDLAKSVREIPAHVVVITEGYGRQLLEQVKAAENIENLYLLDFQDYEELPSVFQSADLLLAVLNEDSSSFSVPSKILGYLAAGKPILGVIPAQNFAAEVLTLSEAGVVVSPAQTARACSEALRLLLDHDRRSILGRNALAFAAAEFDIDRISEDVESICGMLDVTAAPAAMVA